MCLLRDDILKFNLPEYNFRKSVFKIAVSFSFFKKHFPLKSLSGSHRAPFLYRTKLQMEKYGRTGRGEAFQ